MYAYMTEIKHIFNGISKLIIGSNEIHFIESMDVDFAVYTTKILIDFDVMKKNTTQERERERE